MILIIILCSYSFDIDIDILKKKTYTYFSGYIWKAIPIQHWFKLKYVIKQENGRTVRLCPLL